MREQTFRSRRREAALRLFGSGDLFIAGLLIMPAFLFNPSIPLRVYQFFLFWLFAFLVGRRNSIAATALISLSIILFNLTVPYGKVLWELGPFRLTEGALLAGIEKAVTLEGLIMLSRAAIRSDLRLPGRFGSLIGESFRIFDLIMERKGSVDWKDPIAGIDALMLDLSEDRRIDAGPGETVRQHRANAAAGRLLLTGGVLLAWVPLAALFL